VQSCAAYFRITSQFDQRIIASVGQVSCEEPAMSPLRNGMAAQFSNMLAPLYFGVEHPGTRPLAPTQTNRRVSVVPG